jgi:hypothetical protein
VTAVWDGSASAAVWAVVFVAVLLAAVVGGYELWQWYASAGDPVPHEGIPRE